MFRMYRSRGDPLSQASGPAPLFPLTLSRDDGSMINRGGDFLVPQDFFLLRLSFLLDGKVREDFVRENGKKGSERGRREADGGDVPFD